MILLINIISIYALLTLFCIIASFLKMWRDFGLGDCLFDAIGLCVKDGVYQRKFGSDSSFCCSDEFGVLFGGDTVGDSSGLTMIFKYFDR